MTRRERLERRIEKRQEWAESRRAKAAAGFAKADAIARNIPLGQPILIGHHSERHHRRDIERIDSGMRAGVESSKMAEHHDNKADGLQSQLDRSTFSDDPDAIEQLEAKIAKAEAKQANYKAINRIVNAKPKHQATPDKLAALVKLGMSEATAAKCFEADFCGRVGIPSYALQNNNANIRRMRQRIEDIKRRQARTAQAEANGGITIKITPASNYHGMPLPSYAVVTFAEKPAREVIDALKAAGYGWGGGSWSGHADRLPECVRQLQQ